ncbi:MAG: HD domain-containing protein [Mariprofundales bacterium]
MNTQPNILIVEDNMAHATLISRAFADNNSCWQLKHVKTLQEAKAALAQQQPDLMIIDNRLPDGDGIKLLPKSIEARTFPIIMMTAYGDENMAVNVLKSGALDYIVKSNIMFAEMPHIAERALREWQHIIDKKHAEEALRQSEHIVSSITDMIAMLDKNFIYLAANPAYLQTFNKTLDELIGHSVTEVLGETLFNEMHPQADSCLDGEDITYQAWFDFPNSKRRFMDIHYYPYRLANKEIAGFIINGRDISSKVESKNELIKAHAELMDSLVGTINAISKAVEAKDPYTAGHQRRVAEIACAIAQEMGLSSNQIQGILMGGMIHDIGKIQTPSDLLSKPSKLKAIEYRLIQEHAIIGYQILKDIKFPWPVADIAYQHHERINGSGYPQGLRGEEICLEARIVAVADVVEAISSHRPYRPALGINIALEEIKSKRGIFYDSEVVDACLKAVAENKIEILS